MYTDVDTEGGKGERGVKEVNLSMAEMIMWLS